MGLRKLAQIVATVSLREALLSLPKKEKSPPAFFLFVGEGTDTRKLRDHLYQWLLWARQTRQTYIFQKQQHVIISRKTATRRIAKATATKMIIVSRSSSMMINKINKWFDSMYLYRGSSLPVFTSKPGVTSCDNTLKFYNRTPALYT